MSEAFFGIDWCDSVARFQTTSGVFTGPDPLAEKYYSVSPYAYCAGDPVNRIDPDGMDDRDKVAGAIIGVVSNIIPGTGSLRDIYRPVDSADYNHALQRADEASAFLGGVIIATGGGMDAAGSAAVAGGTIAIATVAGAPEGAIAVAGGTTVATVGATLVTGGIVMLANTADNAKEGYNRGKEQRQSGAVKHKNRSVNKESGLPDVRVPKGYRKTNYVSHGKRVYTNGKNYISRDADSHNGGVWKKAKSVKELQNRNSRLGTYDENLKKIGR